jgi:hypothetical protein
VKPKKSYQERFEGQFPGKKIKGDEKEMIALLFSSPQFLRDR